LPESAAIFNVACNTCASTRSVIRTLIVLLAVPFSLIGALWLLYLLSYNMSVAVWVGLIALAGIDADAVVSCCSIQQGQLADVGDLNFKLDMNIPGMQMRPGGRVERTRAPRQYLVKIKTDMAGDWNAKLSFEDPHGQGQQSFLVTVK